MCIRDSTVVIDLDTLEPTVSYPHLPENTHLAKEGADIKIDQVAVSYTHLDVYKRQVLYHAGARPASTARINRRRAAYR